MARVVFVDDLVGELESIHLEDEVPHELETQSNIKEEQVRNNQSFDMAPSEGEHSREWRRNKNHPLKNIIVTLNKVHLHDTFLACSMNLICSISLVEVFCVS